MDFDSQVKLAIYRHFANSGERPSPNAIAVAVGSNIDSVLSAYKILRENRMLVLEPNGATIRMAPPFSGVPTQHVIISDNKRYFANCAWDALGIVTALQRSGTVYSRCEQSFEPLTLQIGDNGPEPSDWLFHCLVPAAQWWDDIVFT
jgi:Alkylmercury lyase